jgi:Trk K+ transport system NAD-binding subunit
MNAPAALKIYGALLMFCGAAMVALLFSFMADYLLQSRLRTALVRRCSHFRGHIIVAGLGNIGYRTARELSQRGKSVVAIERNPEGKFVEAAGAWATVILGNARTEETLQKAGLAGAKAVLAVTDDDLSNLSIGLAAKRMHPGVRAVLRIFDPQLADTTHACLGMDAVLSVSAVAAATFAGAALTPGAHHGLVLGNYLIVLFTRRIPDPGQAAGALTGALDNEIILLRQRAGESCYAACAPGIAVAPGDELLGAHWYRLREDA